MTKFFLLFAAKIIIWLALAVCFVATVAAGGWLLIVWATGFNS